MPSDPSPPDLLPPDPLSSSLPSEDATLLMLAAADGDKIAADRLFPLVYQQLRKAAQIGLQGERSGHTLSATALVHEAYLKLVGPRQVPWASRGHFYAAAAQAMCRILLDHAKAKGRQKRGGTDRRLARPATFASVEELAADADSDEIVSFDSALRRLEAESPDTARVVQLRFYVGLSIEQTAQALGVSDRTVNRLWTYARAWLHRELKQEQSKD